MNTLPDSIQHYLHSLWIENGKFSYISIDTQGVIKRVHCNIDYYGLTDLGNGDSAMKKLIFLEGLFPYQETDIFILPSINFANGIAADIHILPIENDIYILFFDVTEHIKQRQILQQERHNIDLLYQQQTKNIKLLKQTYQELDVKKQQADLANKEKSQLMSYITHDLRTPLTSILGFAQFLEANIFGDLTKKQRDCIVKMINAGKHMNELINDILDAAHLESGNIELQLEPLSAHIAIAECIAWLQPIAEKQSITFINRVLSNVKIQVDAKRFTQIMLNVLNNAIKYNREYGCIVVACNVLEKSLRISVKDTGIGIADSQLEKMFQPFARVLDKNKAKKIEGHGVGLSECKQLVELMQGTLSVRSELTVGSVFYIDLPLAINDQGKQTHHPNHRLVYFYQEAINFELLDNLLSAYKNIQLISCDTIIQAKQLCLQHPTTLLFMDINHEQLTDNIAQLRHLQHQFNKQRIIAVVAKQAPAFAIQKILRQTHLDDYLTCPFDFNQVLDMLE